MAKGVDILLVDDGPGLCGCHPAGAGGGRVRRSHGAARPGRARSGSPEDAGPHHLGHHHAGQDGFTVCEVLKGDPGLCHVPVMMLTSFAGRVSETSLALRQGMMLEAEDYVDKPVRPPELLRRIEKLLARLKQTDEAAGLQGQEVGP